MSAQLIELIIFAGIAFVIIGKLISMLGTTSEDDPTRNKKSFFGESSTLKDVTNKSTGGFGNKAGKIITATFADLKGGENFGNLIVQENKEHITEALQEVSVRMPSFKLDKFIKSAKVAFKLILDKAVNKQPDLSSLVDKRYIEAFSGMVSDYGNYLPSADINAQVSDIYMFGNNIFIKVLFIGKNITDKIRDLHEEWTFTRSTLSSTPEWYLSNIDRPN